eukprot:226292-Hanusia_phi.AAC.1
MGEDDDYYENYYNYRNMGYDQPKETEEEMTGRIAREKRDKRVQAWRDEPLSAPKNSQWSYLKGFFSPDEQDSVPVRAVACADMLLL